MLSARKRGGCGLAAAALVVALTAAPAAPATPAAPGLEGVVQSYDTYKDWFIACDNALSCVAKSFEELKAEIKISREAGPRGAVTAEIRANFEFKIDEVRIDGKPAQLSKSAWERVVDGEVVSLKSDDAAAVHALVQQLRNAATATLGGAKVPLAGFSAAMLRMDDRQGRVGGETSFMRPGPKPASQTPSPPNLPKIPPRPIVATLSADEAGRLIAQTRAGQAPVLKAEDCNDNAFDTMDPEAHALDSKRALVFVPCAQAAYQGSWLAFIVPRDGGGVSRVVVPRPYLGADPRILEQSFFTFFSFNATKGELHDFSKGRGLGDCGSSASWIWNGDAFQLTSMYQQYRCGGIMEGWPPLFRSVQ